MDRAVRGRRPPARRLDPGRLTGRDVATTPDGRTTPVVLIAPDGAIAATYRKIHLFDVDRRGRAGRPRVGPGDARAIGPVVADVDGVRSACRSATTCASRSCTGRWPLAGAEVLTVPANFTERTGRDHWEVLLRARAIENGAYVLAPSQIGGPPGQPAFGRSMIVDPWGTVVAQAPDRVGIVTAELDLDRVRSVRRQIPVLANRRPEAAAQVETVSSRPVTVAENRTAG